MEILRTEKISTEDYSRFEQRKYYVLSIIPYVQNPQLVWARYTRSELDEWLQSPRQYGEIIVSIEPDFYGNE